MPNAHDEIGRLAAVINDTFARLESSFDQLRRFTADASHELRTPLSVIRGIGELGLAKPEHRPNTKRRWARCSRRSIGSPGWSIRYCNSLAGDAGTVRLSRDVVDLGDLARDVASSLSLLAEERRQRLDVASAADVRVLADRLVLRDAVTNLVDNAIKYSPEASTIEVHVDGGPEQATMTVADTGAGIPTEHRDRIFDRFYRIDEGRAREMGGTGLGLAIAKWAVEANGGQIVLEPTSQGSVFRISLPRLGAPTSA